MGTVGGQVAWALAISVQTPAPAQLEIVGRFEDRRIAESSGIAVSRRNDGVLWTHNDSGDGPYLYATDVTGRAFGRLRITGAVARDWEDIASGPCPDAIEDACLYVADTGDNLHLRRFVTVYAVRDPAPPVRETEPARALALRYPDGSRDVEAIFVDSLATVHLITKGNRGSIDHYAVSRTAWGRETVVTARHIQTVGIRATRRRLVTGVAIAPSGATVAVRTRRFLYLFTVRGERLGDEPTAVCATDLPSDGEAVDFLSEHVLVLTSESDGANPAPLYRLRCADSSSGS